ncbi:MAG: hypothetical protein AMXMBFR34_15320 [Myxococcaceae bacterium]
MNFLRVAPLAVLAVLALTACPDPAKNKPKAQVTAAPAEPAHPAGAPAPPAIPGTPLRFSEAGSSISWTGAKVTASHAGTFQKFNGAIGLVDGDPAKSVVYVSVVTDSIFTADSADLLEHLKGADFFDVQKFPLATFRSTAISAGGGGSATHSVTGLLELHGVTKTITFPATITAAADAVTVRAEFALNRKDFGISYPGKPDNLIRDEVVLKLDITAKPSQGG